MTNFNFKFLGAWLVIVASITGLQAQNDSTLKGKDEMVPAGVWNDVNGEYINAHGGGILLFDSKYYWFGEHRPAKGFSTEVGVTCYSSTDLCNWRYEGVALSVSEEAGNFKKDGTYWMITSGCTGWAPNAARLFSAPSIWGPWTQHPNPCRGEGSDKTFGGQSTYVLQLPGNRYLFMADIWRPKSLMYSEYLWIPVRFDEEGMPYLTLSGKCNPSDGR